MLSRLLKEHQAKQNERKDLQGEASWRELASMLISAKNKDWCPMLKINVCVVRL